MPRHGDADERTLRAREMSISLLTVVTAITGLMYSLARIRREYFSPEVLDALLAIALVSTAMLLSALVSLVSTRSFERSKKRAPSHVPRLIISTAVYAVFAILILKFAYAKDITTLLAATAALTVGLAWGLREPIAHLFSGLVLEIERPWAVGDYVGFKDRSGRGEALKWRNVHVRTVYDTLLVLPESEIANSLAEVFPANRTCLHFVDLVTYGPGERVRAHQQRPDSLFIGLRGRSHVRFRSDDQRRPDSDIGTGAASVASHPGASHWNRHALQQASKDLTFVLGPVAPRLVEREARCTSDLFELYHRLGRHIDDDDERRSFLERGPDAHVRELTAGDGLSGAAGDEQRLLEALVVAAQEAELMELTGEGKRAAMAEHGPLADALAALAERAHKPGIRLRLFNRMRSELVVDRRVLCCASGAQVVV
jgi:uncharacterized membrane protein YidH (DUF202 family)